MTVRGILENKHWLIKVITWVSITMVLTLFAMFVWSVLPGRGTVANLKWLQFLQTTATFLLPPLCLAYLCSKQPLTFLRLQSSLSSSSSAATTIIVAIATILLAIPGINLLSYLNQQMNLPAFLEPLEQLMKQQEEAAAALTESFLQVHTIGGLIINIALMALLPAMAEELTFRGLLVTPFLPQPTIGKQKTQIAIWAAAIIFSAIHFQFYGFVPRMLLGALFGYALLWSDSLWIPIMMHFTNNCIAVLLYYYMYAQGIDPETIDAFGTGSTLWVGLLSLALLVPTIYFLRLILLARRS